jgi:hypothetical protein
MVQAQSVPESFPCSQRSNYLLQTKPSSSRFSLCVLVSLCDLATCPSRLHASGDHHPFMTVHTKVDTEVEGKHSFTDHGPLPMTEQTWPSHNNLQCFFYWRIFAEFRPGENRYDFDIYKGFSMEKNDPNSPYFGIFVFKSLECFDKFHQVSKNIKGFGYFSTFISNMQPNLAKLLCE